MFFNQVLLLGFIVSSFQIYDHWTYIGAKSIIFAIVLLAAPISFFLNRRGDFKISKRFFIFLVYGLGVYTTTLLGGTGLYHLGVFSTFVFSLILFDVRSEKVEILLGLPFVLACIIIGEYGLFGAPDFSQHPSIGIARITNILSTLAINGILALFIIRLNHKTEDELTSVIIEKNRLLDEIGYKTLLLENNKLQLEEIVLARTAEISAQKNTLIRQNEEKEILLKEVHHRVKNNLQIIISLLNLQSSKFTDEDSIEAMNETKGRILSMALAHTKMYQSETLKEISLKTYCTQLIFETQDLFGITETNYELSIPDSIKFEMERVIPLGLILNEIITNFFKHVAVKVDEKTYFEITMEDFSDVFYRITYRDSGKGFGSTQLSTDDETLGLQLIESLVGQLEGEFTFFNNRGAVYQFTVKK